jgi:hypothetical protein
MGDVARLNLTPKAAEARLRSLMEDVVESHLGVHPPHSLALAVWFGGSSGRVQKLLELFSGLPGQGPGTFADPVRFSLLWKTGSQDPPFVEVSAASVEHFAQLLASGHGDVSRFFDRPDVLFFEKELLSETILKSFNILTEPPGLMKGWYVDSDQAKGRTVRDLLSSWGGSKPQLGLVKTWESPDFENCRGLIHFEINQRWLPLSLAGLRNFTFFNDLQAGRPGFFLFRGGSFYEPLKFEEKTEPAYSNLVLQRSSDDRYPEVYLRSVRPSEKPAA